MNKERAQAGAGMHMHTAEARIQMPKGTPPRVLQDIAQYNALVSMQNRMSASAPWYQRLS